jgi:hypothetical protein
MRQLKQKDIATVRLELIEEQHGLCCLCNQIINNPVLDHCHRSGLIRGVLCRGCNAALGVLENRMAMYGLTDESKLKSFLDNLIEYRKQHYELIHPKHGKVKKRPKKVSPKLSK